jgi:FSR family fosmidomycin resistance protein-like MFS transporter
MAKDFTATATSLTPALQTRFNVLGALSCAHFLNDMMQSLIVAIYPILKGDFQLSFVQIGMITLTYQICASLLQPAIGMYTDKHPKPYSLSAGMAFTLVGMVTMAYATSYSSVLVAAALIGTGSAVFHPESSRIARLASGGRHGLAQSIFQVGGNGGAAMGPLLAAWIIIPHGQTSMAWFSLAALAAIILLARVGTWYKHQHLDRSNSGAKPAPSVSPVSPRTAAWSIGILVLLVFSKYFYVASISSYYSFFLIEKFHVSVRSAQLHLFVFLLAMALGTLFGGPLGDRIGRKRVIWVSILGIAPFALLLPYVDLLWTGILTFVIGLILSSAFSAIVVFAQELIPGKVGAVSGLFFGFAFGIGGIGAAVLGGVADHYGIEYVYKICAYLPLLGCVAAFLPNIEQVKTEQRKN